MIIHNGSSAWLFRSAWPLDRHAASAANAHQQQLTKPAGSLGELERIAERFAAWQGRADPRLEQIAIRIFAADHGVCAKGVSAFPQAVTAQMLGNFLQGGAAISVLARQLNADLQVYNLGTVAPPPALPGLRDCTIAPGTRDFSEQPAMSADALVRALRVGAESVPEEPLHLFIGGEMGIGNSTAAAALFSVLLVLPPEMTVGPGAGVDLAGLARKRRAVESGLALHAEAISASEIPALTALECLGGFEIAALTGAYIRCAQRGIGVLVDGYISTAAALCAVRINPQVRDWLLFAHVSAEPAHRLVLERLAAEPLLDLRLRLGEGSGAALAVPLLQAALNLHNNMASFASAAVANRELPLIADEGQS
jgi:nicotinate-nucleotide--dimethylbenzimidazole phosphoribosyltransferase